MFKATVGSGGELLTVLLLGHLCVWDLALFLSQFSDGGLIQLPARPPLFLRPFSSLLGHNQDQDIQERQL